MDGWMDGWRDRGSGWNEVLMSILSQLIVSVILFLIAHFSLPLNSIDQSCLSDGTISAGYYHCACHGDLFFQHSTVLHTHTHWTLARCVCIAVDFF